MKFRNYATGLFYDEMFTADNAVRPGSRLLMEKLESLGPGQLLARQKAAEKALYDMGVAFIVYGYASGTEKIFP